MNRSVTFWVLSLLLLFQSASALVGGALLMAEPSGRLLAMPVSLLDATPFDDYAIPGLVLLALVGVPPLVALYGLWRRPAWTPLVSRLNPARRTHWAWAATIAAGFLLAAWIGVQLALIGYVSRLQPFYGMVGVLIVRLALTKSVRRELARR